MKVIYVDENVLLINNIYKSKNKFNKIMKENRYLTLTSSLCPSLITKYTQTLVLVARVENPFSLDDCFLFKLCHALAIIVCPRINQLLVVLHSGEDLQKGFTKI